MALNATSTIPKTKNSTLVSFSISAQPVVEDNTAKTLFAARRVSINPPAFDIEGTIVTANGVTTITAETSNGFANVNVGDPISLSPGNASGAALPSTTVQSKPDNNTIITTDDATADGSGTSTLRIDPPAVTPTLYAIEEKHYYQGTSIRVEVWLHQYDGSLGSTAGTVANATVSTKVGEQLIDASAFLQKVRVVKSNQDSISL